MQRQRRATERVVQHLDLHPAHSVFGLASATQPAAIFGATQFKSVSEWAQSAADLNAEEENWFSLAGLVGAHQPAETA